MRENDRKHVDRLRSRLDVFSESIADTARAITHSSRIARVIEGFDGTSDDRSSLARALQESALRASKSADEVLRYLTSEASPERRSVARVGVGMNDDLADLTAEDVITIHRIDRRVDSVAPMRRTFDERRIDRLKTAIEQVLCLIDPRWSYLGRWSIELAASYETEPKTRVVVRIESRLYAYASAIAREDDVDGGRSPEQLAILLLEKMLEDVARALVSPAEPPGAPDPRG